MPAEGVEKVAHASILRYEQFLLIAEAAVSLGIEKIRVTGGEPLIRAGVLSFLEQLAKIPGLQQLVLTTNGVLLSTMAQKLKDVGVQRLNISLDSLQPAMFSQLTRRDLLPRVLAGIAAAEKAKLPFKINMVVMRGFNDNEILDFAKLTQERDCTVRFIEYMPTRKENNWQSLVVPSEEVLLRLHDNYCLHPVERGALAGPAEEFAIAGAKGRIGVISPLSGHFCQDCNRIRITASGAVRTCLFSDHDFDLNPLLIPGNIAQVAAKLQQLVDAKPACHTLNSHSEKYSPFFMSQIGG